MVKEFREIAARVTEKAGAEFVDLQEVFDEFIEKAEPTLYSTDTVHPTICGHMVIADLLLTRFVECE